VNRVLVVEDDPANAILMETILSDLGGFEVTVTDDGDRILALVAEGCVDAAVMDVSLSNTRVAGEKVDGIELTRRIRKLPGGAALPVVLVSAHAMRGDAERYLFASGANDYVTKPILDPEGFVRDLRRQITSQPGAGSPGEHAG